MNDVATMSESQDFVAQTIVGGPVTTFTSSNRTIVSYVYRNTDMSLSTFRRASAVAANYQYYKIKYFELEILPDADTFAATGNVGKPYLYYMIDKGNSINFNVTTRDLKNMGAKAIVLDEKPIHIRWAPGVSLSTEISTATGSTSAQMYRISPWLNTDEEASDASWGASQVCHNGIKFFAENNGLPINFSATITAHFAFKKPLIVSQQTPGQVVALPGNVDLSGNPVTIPTYGVSPHTLAPFAQ